MGPSWQSGATHTIGLRKDAKTMTKSGEFSIEYVAALFDALNAIGPQIGAVMRESRPFLTSTKFR